MFGAFWAILSLLAVSFIRKGTRPSPGRLLKGCIDGARAGAGIAAVVACLAPIFGIMTLTGLGIRIPAGVAAISQGNLVIALIMIMLVSILLGCGMPTIGAYLLVALTTAPVLAKMGVDLLSAHFFAFYFAVFSAVTPPFALAALIGSKIAGSSYFRTGVEAFKIAVAAFVIPFLFMYNSALLGGSSSAITAVMSLAATLLGLTSLTIVIVGFYLTNVHPVERALYALCAGGLFAYVVTQDYIHFASGMALFLVLTLYQIWQTKKEEASFGKALPIEP